MDIALPEETQISIDGKKLSGRATKKEQQIPHRQGGKSALQMVHAWCGEFLNLPGIGLPHWKVENQLHCSLDVQFGEYARQSLL